MANSNYKFKIGGEVANEAPTPTLDSHIANKAYVDANGGTGTSNIAAGAFNGVLDVSGGNRYYNDYTSGAVVNLSLSTAKALGSIASVRVQGDLLGTIPSSWNLSGHGKTNKPEFFNELTVLYKNDSDVRIVNRIFDNPNYVSLYIDWEQEVKVIDLGGGTLDYDASVTSGAGFTRGAYSTRAINGDNAVSWTAPQTAGVGTVVGLTDNTFGGFADGTTNALEYYGLINTDSMEYSFGENGVSKFTGVWTHGSILKLRLAGTTITLEKDGTTVYTSTKAATLPMTPIGMIHNSFTASEIRSCQFENGTNLEISAI